MFRANISKSRSIPNPINRHIQDLDSPSTMWKILNTQTLHTISVAGSNQLSQLKQAYNNNTNNTTSSGSNSNLKDNYPSNTLPLSFSSINIRSSGQVTNLRG